MGELGPTLVVHVNDPDGFDVYIGRAARRAKEPRAWVSSPWANPFRVGSRFPGGDVHGPVMTREDSVECFEHYLDEGLPPFDGVTAEELAELAGKRLGCWCAQPGQPLTADDLPWVCHGQPLARAADAARADLARSQDLYLRLKGAYERLCAAQVLCDDPLDRQALMKALEAVSYVGSQLPQWSRFDLPDVPPSEEVSRG